MGLNNIGWVEREEDPRMSLETFQHLRSNRGASKKG